MPIFDFFKRTIMRKIIFVSFTWCVLQLLSCGQYGVYDSAKKVAPFKMFDDLYYVGNDQVSAYLLTTSDGLILIDALYGNYTKDILQSLRELGFDPRQIKFILCTHGHFDHYEGADTLQKLTHARIGMTDPDWLIAEGKVQNEYASQRGRLKRDLVIGDGDSLTLGNTTLSFYVTPGHTLGVLSMAFPVRDGKTTYRAFLFGGVGLNFSGVEQTQLYLQSIDRLSRMKDIQVNITNHPFQGRIFERETLLKQRKDGELNPYVDPKAFQVWLIELRNAAEKKLETEKAKAP
jgi:metallo-beta-lactamase class B